jgi:hypothetical protein
MIIPGGFYSYEAARGASSRFFFFQHDPTRAKGGSRQNTFTIPETIHFRARGILLLQLFY